MKTRPEGTDITISIVLGARINQLQPSATIEALFKKKEKETQSLHSQKKISINQEILLKIDTLFLKQNCYKYIYKIIEFNIVAKTVAKLILKYCISNNLTLEL